MTRLLRAGGASTVLVGVGLLLPALVARLEERATATLGGVVVLLAGVLILGGSIALLRGFRRPGGAPMPAPVRAVVTANCLFLAFCALETSDRLLRQEGRIFYWTTFLLVPALLLLCGVFWGQRWAWWAMRVVTVVFALVFVGVLGLVPFADLRGNDGPVPWWGRIHVAGLTLLFASTSAYVFYALGRAEARSYFGMSHRAEPDAAPEPART